MGTSTSPLERYALAPLEPVRAMSMSPSVICDRTSVQLLIGVAVIALFANSAVDRTHDGLPWEITLVGFCVFAVVFSAIYAKRTEVALSTIRIAAKASHAMSPARTDG